MDTNTISNVCPIGGPGNGGPAYSGGLVFNSEWQCRPHSFDREHHHRHEVQRPERQRGAGSQRSGCWRGGRFTWTTTTTACSKRHGAVGSDRPWGDVHDHRRRTRQLEGARSRPGRLDESYPTTSDIFGRFQPVTVPSKRVRVGGRFRESTQPGSISGMKFNDLNDSGVQIPTSRGWPGGRFTWTDNNDGVFERRRGRRR